MNDRTEQQFGDYRLIRLIGAGGFSDVYLGEDIRRKTQVAIKIYSQRLASPEDTAKFINELRSLFRLEHPHILGILDFGIERDSSYLVMPYAFNGTLARLHPEGTIVSLASVVSYVKQIASALQYAHDQRIIHRDVKPQNMLIGSNNEILLSDFGIATIASDSSDQNLRAMMGTPLYIAPEQIQGKPQLASDQYALGVTVYQWLCGELPYHGSLTDILYQHIGAPPPSLRAKVPTISPDVENVVLKALSKDPKQRYARVMDFSDALEQAVLANPSQSSDASITSTISTKSHQEQSVVESGDITMKADNEDFGATSPELRAEAPGQTIFPDLSPPIQIASAVSSTLLFTHTIPSQRDLRDFFIMYTRADRKWAIWVAWELEEAKYSVILPPWYLHSQSNFDMEMEKAAAKAKRTVIILSRDSLNILKAQPMHIAMLQRELANNQNKLLSICVHECGSEYRQLLDSLHHIDIAGEDELTARTILLASVQGQSISLTLRPAFPGATIRRFVDVEPTFPPDTSSTTQEQFSEAISFNDVVSSTPSLSLPDIEIFFSYSHKDKKLRNELEKFMSHLKRHPSIKSWHDGEIAAGMVWAQEIDRHLNKANIILLLVSQDFIASNYCYDIEMQKAIQRHAAGEARVIPIILRPAFWEDTPIGKLQALPTGARPITLWSNRSLAFMDVVKGIQRAIEQLASKI